MSGNPGGRSKGIERQFREAFADLQHSFSLKGEDFELSGETAFVRRIWDIAMNGSDRDAIAAIKFYYERAHGLPKQKVTIEPPEEDVDEDAAIEGLSDDELRVLAKVRALAAPQPADDDGVH